MNIKSIKNRAAEVLFSNRSRFIRVLLIVMILQTIPNLFTATNPIVSLISLILTIVFLPVGHGLIVSALKIVRNNGDAVEDQDAFVGFKRFKELIGTYAAVWLFVFVAMIVFVLILGAIIAGVAGNVIMSLISLSNPTIETIVTLLAGNPALIWSILLISVLSLVFGFILDALLFAVPYLLEQYHITGMNAIKTSISMMKGHIFDYIKLFFSFFGWMFLSALIEGFLSQLISMGTVVTIIVSLFQIYTYLPLYSISQAVLFEEMSFYYFNQVGE